MRTPPVQADQHQQLQYVVCCPTVGKRGAVVGRMHAVNLTCCKALICHIKEGHMALGLAQVSYLLPLLRGGVNAGRVVGTPCRPVGPRNNGTAQHASDQQKPQTYLSRVFLRWLLEAVAGSSGWAGHVFDLKAVRQQLVCQPLTMQQDDAAVWCCSDILHHPLEVKANSVRVKVPDTSTHTTHNRQRSTRVRRLHTSRTPVPPAHRRASQRAQGVCRQTG